jgi:hypothetical protein
MSESPKKTKKSLGEELFLVHLSRYTPEKVDDFDHEDPEHLHSKSGMTVGEELWQVHCKRASECVEDEDNEASAEEATVRKTKNGNIVPTQAEDPPHEEKVMHLRNRVVQLN